MRMASFGALLPRARPSSCNSGLTGSAVRGSAVRGKMLPAFDLHALGAASGGRTWKHLALLLLLVAGLVVPGFATASPSSAIQGYSARGVLHSLGSLDQRLADLVRPIVSSFNFTLPEHLLRRGVAYLGGLRRRRRRLLQYLQCMASCLVPCPPFSAWPSTFRTTNQPKPH